MTLQQFRYKYKKLRSILSVSDYTHFSCPEINDVLGEKAKFFYRQFIKTHTLHLIGDLLKESTNQQPYLRILLIDSFYQECITTKIYTKF
jgi:hypothetical protein